MNRTETWATLLSIEEGQMKDTVTREHQTGTSTRSRGHREDASGANEEESNGTGTATQQGAVGSEHQKQQTLDDQEQPVHSSEMDCMDVINEKVQMTDMSVAEEQGTETTGGQEIGAAMPRRPTQGRRDRKPLLSE
jgi:hypothetical protein